MTKIKNDAPAIMSVPDFYQQGKWWMTGGGNWLRIKDMHPQHRTNAAALLVREATDRAARLGQVELALYRSAPDEVWAEWETFLEERNADPVAWMKGTKLYRSLTKTQAAIDRLSALPEIKVARGGVTWPMPDVIERAKPFLALCGACDAGLPMSCTCPSGDVRAIILSLVQEIEDMRSMELVVTDEVILAYRQAVRGARASHGALAHSRAGLTAALKVAERQLRGRSEL